MAAAGLVRAPTVMRGVISVANVPGIAWGQLRLDGPTAADIFRGAIGQVDFADARKNDLKFISPRNKAGSFVLPGGDSFRAAAEGANFHVKGVAPDLLDQAHEKAWPIVTARYILAHDKGDDCGRHG
ncbi:MAG: hypothetical protein H6942_08810 [Candidatus Accumulibacter sp.]|uniref:hypothetical protein n=1 Tax=Accumulibacter sp. TaxID=2053492 RepID=UPI0025F1E2A7|nr:hypothetical protein [Accumulibacter sp.]MCP5248612.1 hypothetical protein [Accumulibacter sp.]